MSIIYYRKGKPPAPLLKDMFGSERRRAKVTVIWGGIILFAHVCVCARAHARARA